MQNMNKYRSSNANVLFYESEIIHLAFFNYYMKYSIFVKNKTIVDTPRFHDKINQKVAQQKCGKMEGG